MSNQIREGFTEGLCDKCGRLTSDGVGAVHRCEECNVPLQLLRVIPRPYGCPVTGEDPRQAAFGSFDPSSICRRCGGSGRAYEPIDLRDVVKDIVKMIEVRTHCAGNGATTYYKSTPIMVKSQNATQDQGVGR